MTVNWFYLWRAADGPNDVANCYFVMPHTHPGLSAHSWPMLMGAASTQAQGYPLPSHQPSINASACPCLHSLPEQLAEPLLHTQAHIDTHLVHYPSLYQGDGNLCLSSCLLPILFWPGILQVKTVFAVIPSVRWNRGPSTIFGRKFHMTDTFSIYLFGSRSCLI